MCGLQTRPRTDVDPPRFLPSAGGLSSRRPRGDTLFLVANSVLFIQKQSWFWDGVIYSKVTVRVRYVKGYKITVCVLLGLKLVVAAVLTSINDAIDFLCFERR